MRRHKRCKTHNDIVAHFQKRCLERIGIILNQRILKSLLAENKLRRLYAQSNTKTHFLLRKDQYNGAQMLQFDVVVIYDKLRHGFVTTYKYDGRQYSKLMTIEDGCLFGHVNYKNYFHNEEAKQESKS